jgi:hypothetical protein
MTSLPALSLLLRTLIEEAPIEDPDREPQNPSIDESKIVPETSARDVQEGPPGTQRPTKNRRVGCKGVRCDFLLNLIHGVR